MNNIEDTEIATNDKIEQEMNRKIVIFISFNKKIETTPKEIDEALGNNVLYNTLLDDTLSKKNKQEILVQQMNKYVETVVMKKIDTKYTKEMHSVMINIFGKTVELSNQDYKLIRNFSITCILSTLFVIIVYLTGKEASDFIYVIRCCIEMILYYFVFRFIRRGLDFIIK